MVHKFKAGCDQHLYVLLEMSTENISKVNVGDVMMILFIVIKNESRGYSLHFFILVKNSQIWLFLSADRAL